MSLVPTREETPHIVRYSGPAGHRKLNAPSGATGFSFTGRDFLRVLRQRKWLIILSFLIFTVASVGATWLWVKFAPFYTAEARLVVNPPKATDLGADRGLLAREMMERLMLSYAMASKTEEVFKKAMEQDKDNRIRDTKWFEKTSRGDGDVMQALFNEVDVGVIPRTNFLRIRMTGRNKEDISDIVNAIAGAVVADAKSVASADRDKAIARLTTELTKVEEGRENAIKAIHSYRSGATSTTDESPETLRAGSGILQQHLAVVQRDFTAAAQSLETVKNQTEEELAEMPEVQQQLQYDPLLRQFESRSRALELELDAAKTKYLPNHKVVKDLQTRVELAEKQYNVKKKEVTQKAVANLKAMRNSVYLSLSAQSAELLMQKRTIDEKIKTMQVRLANLKTAEEEKIAADVRLAQLKGRLLDLRLLKRGEQPLVFHRPAMLPREVSMPKFTIMVPIGVLLGLVFGLGIAFLLEFMDASIKAPADIARRVDLPMLGMVPHLDDVEEEIEDLRVAFITNPNTIVCEAFRQIRMTLQFSGPAERQKSILVTSPMPEDGRTSICLNLGHAIAGSGKRVLVIDANFRQPMIRRLFPKCPESGLSTTLVEQIDWKDLAYEVEPNLHVMAAGPIPPNPSELLGSDQMRTRLEEFTREYDHVIFDSSPCMVVTDAGVLSAMVDGTILVARAGVNTHGIVQRTRDMLNQVGTHIFGVVLNGVRVTAGGYLRKNYETFYEYRDLPQLPTAAGSGKSKTAAGGS